MHRFSMQNISHLLGRPLKIILIHEVGGGEMEKNILAYSYTK